MINNKEYTVFAMHIVEIYSSIEKWKTLRIYYTEKLKIRILRVKGIPIIIYINSNVY
jgi:hypothetical protein